MAFLLEAIKVFNMKISKGKVKKLKNSILLFF